MIFRSAHCSLPILQTEVCTPTRQERLDLTVVTYTGRKSYEIMSHILIVDDNPDNLRLLVNLLSHQGYHVRPTRDGRTALNSARLNPPDLILLDIMMPAPDGFAVCSLLKADERTQDIPIIFVSALNEVFDKIKAFSLGGVDYITKPFHEEEVLVRVRTHLTLRTLQKQLQEQNTLLQEQNARFRTLEEATFEGIVIHDENQDH